MFKKRLTLWSIKPSRPGKRDEVEKYRKFPYNYYQALKVCNTIESFTGCQLANQHFGVMAVPLIAPSSPYLWVNLV